MYIFLSLLILELSTTSYLEQLQLLKRKQLNGFHMILTKSESCPPLLTVKVY